MAVRKSVWLKHSEEKDGTKSSQRDRGGVHGEWRSRSVFRKLSWAFWLLL